MNFLRKLRKSLDIHEQQFDLIWIRKALESLHWRISYEQVISYNGKVSEEINLEYNRYIYEKIQVVSCPSIWK
jgi:hypothetical protein